MTAPWPRRLLPYMLALGALAAAAPILSARHQPAVDFPQHAFLTHVLRTAGEAGSFYGGTYRVKPGLTYVTFYYFARLLAPLLGEEHALQLWLALVAAAIPLSMALLLRQLGRSEWLALLAVPLVLTDNYYWGLIAFLSSVPLTILVLAFLLEVLQRPDESRAPAIWLAVSLVLLQLTHAAGMIFPALAVPVLMLMTPASWARRGRALLALAPGVALFLLWVGLSMSAGRHVGDPNAPWTAGGPIWDPNNFTFVPWRARLDQFPGLLANGFWSWADRPPVTALFVLAGAGFLATLVWRQNWFWLSVAGWRGAALFALAMACYFFLPFDIKGYMYQVYPRYAQVAALLAIPLLALPPKPLAGVFVAAAAGVALFSSATLVRLFSAFDVEARSFERIAAEIPPHSRIMHLVLDPGSHVASHTVYLHYAALAALRRDGIPSFSLALDPSFPVGYQPGKKPPASPSEWRPQQFDWETQGSWYDYYLVRGNVPPSWVFHGHADDVELVDRQGAWSLYHRIGDAR